MKIINKKKFLVRILELAIIITTIILTIVSFKYASQIRNNSAVGGECLIPILGLISIVVTETIYEESESNKRDGKKDESKR